VLLNRFNKIYIDVNISYLLSYTNHFTLLYGASLLSDIYLLADLSSSKNEFFCLEYLRFT
jgi:hypothetical protein